ncbi:MAG: hypothetical protein R2710_00990 [Acidimicrobiales bacterium]
MVSYRGASGGSIITLTEAGGVELAETLDQLIGGTDHARRRHEFGRHDRGFVGKDPAVVPGMNPLVAVGLRCLRSTTAT